jgi:hypothetical protein
VREFNLSSFDELLADIGLGNRVAALIAKRLLPEANKKRPPPLPGRQRPTAADQGHRRRGGQLSANAVGRCRATPSSAFSTPGAGS